ncbi:MAG: hypothetical protein A3I05_09350 [Deltaproteobacteria bacterium RIFCSPLOWO2_02_FULL_44_10]|nr:MAG: hypothetical protein A3C46_07630 [Deltaproteobacteria bacterium RIFCSPHIGHO2_02_FULL_44_16]OGQ47418.1 MAG: hypothetical protein A3I05_09350 [Deltaproteobacteria bacterium RIFCSPLOWO2_02_FULL_44_10]
MNPENSFMLKMAFTVAEKLKADAVVLYADPLEDLNFPLKLPRRKIPLILLSRKKKFEAEQVNAENTGLHITSVISLPRIQMTRVSIIKVATTLALSGDFIKPGNIVVFVVGPHDGGFLDLIHIVDTSKESEIITGRGLSKISETVKPEIFQAVLNLAVELADKGREGKPIGTIFVLGDHEKVLQLSKQMIINPFKGYEEDERHILHSGLKETIREFSALDGAFVLTDEGTILTAGRYLGAAIEESNLPRGLGSRHLAAAGITSLTKAIAIAISESSGDVRIFKNGKVVMHIEKGPTKK